MFKYWLISLGYFFGCFFGLSFLLTILNYFNIFNASIISVLKLVVPGVSMLISGYIMGSHSKEKGYLEGIKIGISVMVIFVLIVLLLDKLSIKSWIYYAILLLVAIMGSMIGINKKKN